MPDTTNIIRKILFVCIGNSARSVMAEGFFNAYAGKGVSASSAGTRPAGEVSRTAVELMKEKGIDISKKKPALLTPEMIEEADLIITMGCGVEESCPVILKKPTEDWGLEDPYNMQREKFISVMDEIERRVLQLIEDIKRRNRSV